MTPSEFVFVGAGPVGLWAAIQLKKRLPHATVSVYERHEVYQRSHVLRLDHWSMLLYGRNHRSKSDALQTQFYQEVAGKQLSGLVWTPAQSLFIRTNDLEAALKRYALALGVNIVLRRIGSPEEAQTLHPNCRHFIAADGAHSALRQALVGDVVQQPLQHVVEVKYQVQGSAVRLGALVEQFKANTKLEHMAFEYVGRERNGVCPVTLRFFVDKATYERIPAATFKEPLAVDDPRLPASLRRDIERYMALRSASGTEQYCRKSGRVTKLVLSVYHAPEFAVVQDGRAWFLVGDAAMGVPYFRALNCGMILANRLCQLLASSTWPISGRMDRQVAFYRFHQRLHVATEFSIARSKNFAVQVYDWARQTVALTPDAQLEGEDALGFERLLTVDCRPPQE